MISTSLQWLFFCLEKQILISELSFIVVSSVGSFLFYENLLANNFHFTESTLFCYLRHIRFCDKLTCITEEYHAFKKNFFVIILFFSFQFFFFFIDLLIVCCLDLAYDPVWASPPPTSPRTHTNSISPSTPVPSPRNAVSPPTPAPRSGRLPSGGRKFRYEDFNYTKVLGKGSFGKVSNKLFLEQWGLFWFIIAWLGEEIEFSISSYLYLRLDLSIKQSFQPRFVWRRVTAS